MDKKKSSGKSEWIKCQSKSNPGRCYMFNKQTGETNWCETKADAAKGKTSPLEEVNKELSVVVNPRPTWTYTKPAKTPAQDRLKRLQAKLKSNKQKGEEKNNNANKNGKADKNNRQREKAATEQLQTEEDDRPTTSAAVVTTTGSKAQAKPATANAIVKKSKKKGIQKSRPATTPVTKREVVINVPKDAIIEGYKQDTIERSNTWNYGNGIVSKITEICKNTFKNATKVLEEGTRRVAKQSFKIPKKASNTATNNSLAVQLATPGSLYTPAHVMGSANSRLEQLRQSLQQEQKANGQAAPNLCANLSGINSMQRITSTNIDNASEPMDWQSNDEGLDENTKVLTVYTNNYPTLSTSSSMAPNSNSMGEYYGMVNENLLRLSAEKQRNSKSVHKWLENHYYFVVDTNVLLQHVTFIDDLSKMKLCDTNGTILYIPYMVLQELDKLKMRGVTESAKTLAARAIKYLNAQLEASNQHFQAQSALEERKHFITVASPDDSIINCCLQVKQHVENIILLTEDINLRNKALCNNLLVSTKSDLVSMHPSSIINTTITINTTTVTSTITTSKTPVPAIK